MNEEAEMNLGKKKLKKMKKEESRKQERMGELKSRLVKWGGLILVVLLLGWWVYNAQVPIPSGEENKSVDKPMANEWIKGDPESEVVLIEYSDFQCPACLAYEPILTELTQKYGDRIAFVYRHFPLKQIHLQAEAAAIAAEAAGKQGKFWEMHDKLFATQSQWAENRRAKSMFEDYAGELGLDINKFKQDVKSKEVRGLVKADFQHGLVLGINSTPTFYLNGERLDNPRSVEEFESLIEAQLPATASGELEE